MRPARLTLTSLTVMVVFAAGAPIASARVYDVADVLDGTLERVAARTDVPVRLPAQLDLDFDARVYPDGTGRKGSYSFGLAGAPRCANATACFLAELDAKRGGTPAFRTKVRLRGGRTGWYKGLSCGGSCS